MKKKDKSKNTLAIVRVSSNEQARTGTSIESQLEWNKKIEEDMDLNVALRITDVISGKTFPIKHFDTILKTADKIGIDYITVYDIDRYARNYVYGGYLLQKLHEKRSIEIVTHYRIYDLNNQEDKFWVGFLLLLAERNQGDRLEKTVRGIVTRLKKGEWVLRPPFGYEIIDDNRKLQLKHGYGETIQFIFRTFLQVRKYRETARIVNRKYGKKMDFELTGDNVGKIVQNKTYLGYLKWGEEIFGEGDENKPRDELKAIDKETFEKAQVVAKQIRAQYSRYSGSPVKKLVEEYGAEPVVEGLNWKPPCPKCDSYDVQKNGEGGMIKGLSQLKYICKRCKHQFRFPARKQLKRIEKLISFPCRNCGSKDRFVLEKTPTFWKLRCSNCGCEIFLHEYCDQHTVVQFPRIKRKSKKKMKYDEKQIQLQRWM